MKNSSLLICLVSFLLSPTFVFATEESKLVISDSWLEEAIKHIEKEGNLNISPNDRNVVYPIKINTTISSTNSSVENSNVSLSAKGRDLSETPDWMAEYDQADARFGYSVSSAGDVNGDGYSDVIVGAPWYSNAQYGEGCAFVYHGSSSGLSTVHDWMYEPDKMSARFGESVSSAGDVNGDGYSDVIVGAVGYENGETFEGRAFVYHGSESGLSSSPDWMDESDQAYANFGNSVSSAGDVNGDGYSDVIVGAYEYDNEQDNEGAAFVYYGSESGLSSSPDWTAESDQAYANFGNSVSSAGDVNNDGYSDVIVGAYEYDNGQTNEGAAFVYYGSESGLSPSPNWTAESDQTGARFGVSVSSAGDVNGDGFSDVIVGARSYSNGQLQEGGAFVFHGSSGGPSITPDWTAVSGQTSSQFGESVSSAGDVNVDGFSDVIVGAPAYENGQSLEGRAYVYYGSESGLSASPNWIDESDQISASFGNSVSTAGDVNGDGYSDVIVGAVAYDNGQDDEGVAFAYYGSFSGIEDYTDRENIKLSVFPSISTKSFSISFYISEEEAEKELRLRVYNKAGMLVKNLFIGKKAAGNHAINWHGMNNSSQPLPYDIYFISLMKGDKEHLVRKAVLLK
jgi:hypothetical protein